MVSAVDPIDFLIDASFIQFDNFTPVLKTIKVGAVSLTLTLTVDTGDVQMVVLKPGPDFFPGYSQRLVSGDRHIGFLVFGQGLLEMFNSNLNDTLRINVAFLPTVVRSLNSQGGVYSIQGKTGAVNIYTGPTPPERTLFFKQTGQTVDWNAGYLSPATPGIPLLTLNKLEPKFNATFIQDSNLVKVNPDGDGLILSLGVPITTNTVSPALKYSTS